MGRGCGGDAPNILKWSSTRILNDLCLCCVCC